MRRKRAIGIVVHNEKVLLMYRYVKGKEYYVFPGGGVEEGETEDQAVEREVLEETSIVVRAERLLYRITDEYSEHLFYLCKYLSGEPKLGDGEEKDEMTADNVYKPDWYNISELKYIIVYPIEARNWLIEDYPNGFSESIREFDSLVSERLRG
ncbi:DNA mismatch repair protein MutT [Candidatus Campbellbacteria bacterium CG22_combo_CG10-13_8_21_14_all_36_13]|uniref:DNA mismatch repair protein MutT n=1 Tax=Candidatus Campbellbacteria bacterium CG22_combo_CG10-13_8_21_14_all_36_13 TaxID=1974529 RepID=A0A2H0DXJ0_9BACT|nr:MAG: DNA mismatch repair protein MutT [Candidatus Campbellbacteria bacterium CG22_combo_CG10-13_8_21_14_all_36_13]